MRRVAVERICCTGFVGACRAQPVYAGEIQGRSLGVAAYAFNEKGESVVDEVGELVLTEPMPSMPIVLLERQGRLTLPRILLR